jgi:hypothetical protein
MRVLTIIFCLFISINALAQKTDTTKLFIRDASAQVGNDPIYIVDGKVVSSIKDLKSHDIYETAILSDTAAEAIYGARAKNGAMIITTLHGAAIIYQKKLIQFSEKYKNYLAKKGNDDNLSYVINNTMLIARTKHTVEELSDLDSANIKKVEFKTVRQFKTDATVVITTNNDDQ